MTPPTPIPTPIPTPKPEVVIPPEIATVDPGFLNWIEGTAIATWVRESVSLFAYPGLLAAHTMGLAFVVGLSVALSLRVLGVAKQAPIAPMRSFVPVLWAGFGVNAVTGTLLLMASASTLMVNPIFLSKLAFVTLATISVLLLNRALFGDGGGASPSGNARRLAIACIAFWSLAIVTGRLTAYLDLVKNTFFGGGA